MAIPKFRALFSGIFGNTVRLLVRIILYAPEINHDLVIIGKVEICYMQPYQT